LKKSSRSPSCHSLQRFFFYLSLTFSLGSIASCCSDDIDDVVVTNGARNWTALSSPNMVRAVIAAGRQIL
jgi:hypothetical protein